MPQDPNNKPAEGTSTDQANGVNDGGGTQETKSFSEGQVSSLIRKRINEVGCHSYIAQLSNNARICDTG